MNRSLRAELAQRNEERSTDWYVLVNDEQAWELAHGFVCNEVKAMVRTMLEWRKQDEAAAVRHENPLKRKRTARPGRRPPKDAKGQGQ